MSVSEPTRGMKQSRGGLDTQVWRRRRIVLMYAGYVVLCAEIVVHHHFGPSWPTGLRTVAMLVFGVTLLVIVFSWGWLVSDAVRYGFGPPQFRATGVARLRELKAKGYSAGEMKAMLATPPDERQRAVRHTAQAIAFQISAVIVMAGALYVALATSFVSGLWLPHTGPELVAVAAALFLMYSTLPFAVLAWTEPDAANDITD